MVDQLISVAGDHFKYPIADLVFRLTRCDRDATHPETPVSSEIDYSTTLILLIVLFAESYLARVRHFDKSTDPKKKKNGTVIPCQLERLQALGKAV